MGKVFDGCYNVFAWINNTFWGTLFLVGGLWVLFTGRGFWMGLLGIGVGIYFFWTKRMTQKTLEIIQGDDPELAAGDLSAMDEPARPTSPIAAVASPAPAVASQTPAAARRTSTQTPPGSVSRRKTIVKNAFLGASLVFMVLGARALAPDDEGMGATLIFWGVLTLGSFFIYARIRIHRAAEDTLPALPWFEFVIAVLTAAFTPNSNHVSYSPQGAAQLQVQAVAESQPASNAVVPPGSVTRQKLIIRNVILFFAVLLVGLGARAIKDDPESLLQLLLGYGIPAAAVYFLSTRVRFDRATEDTAPAGPWGDMVVATLTGVFATSAPAGTQPIAPDAPAVPAASGVPAVPAASPAVPAVPTAPPAGPAQLDIAPPPAITVPEAPDTFVAWDAPVPAAFDPVAPAPADPASPVFTEPVPLTAIAPATFAVPAPAAAVPTVAAQGTRPPKSIIAAVVIVIAVFAVTGIALSQRAADAGASRDGAISDGAGGGEPTGEYENVEEVEPEPQAEAGEGDLPAATDPIQETIPSHFRGVDELFSQARSDGVSRVEPIAFSGSETAASGELRFALVDSDPVEWYTVDPHDTSATFYIDDVENTLDSYLAAASSDQNYRGIIMFTRDGIGEMYIDTIPGD